MLIYGEFRVARPKGTLIEKKTRNQALRTWFWNSRYGSILIQNRNQNHLLCAIVCDCMVYPDPKFLICKTKKQPHLRLEDDFFYPLQDICDKFIEIKLSVGCLGWA